MTKQHVVSGLYLLFWGLATGCAGSGTISGSKGFISESSYSNTQAIKDSSIAMKYIAEYLIGPGDTLKISYARRLGSYEQDYILTPGDGISVDIEGHPEWSVKSNINPDGKLYLYQIGQIKVAGLTYAQLHQLLLERYGEIINNPRINLFLTDSQVGLKDFLSKLSQGSEGCNLTLTVSMDGSISLPLLGQLNIGGLTIPQAAEQVNERYRRIFRDMDVVINVVNSNSKYVAVLGEVKKPGTIPLTSPLTPAQAVAVSGGFLDTANPGNVVIVRKGKLETVNIDFDQLPDGETARQQGMVLSPDDIVFVPRKGIAEVDLFVDQYIRKMIPLTLGAGVYYNLNPQ